MKERTNRSWDESRSFTARIGIVWSSFQLYLRVLLSGQIILIHSKQKNEQEKSQYNCFMND